MQTSSTLHLFFYLPLIIFLPYYLYDQKTGIAFAGSFNIRLNLDILKLVFPKSAYQCQKQPVSTPLIKHSLMTLHFFNNSFAVFIDSIVPRKLKDTMKAFNDFKNKQKSVWSNVIWYVKVCIFWKCIQYTLHWDKTLILEKFPLEKINGTKMPSVFFREL